MTGYTRKISRGTWLLSLALSLASARVLNALALGEELATGLGQSVALGRVMASKP